MSEHTHTYKDLTVSAVIVTQNWRTSTLGENKLDKIEVITIVMLRCIVNLCVFAYEYIGILNATAPVRAVYWYLSFYINLHWKNVFDIIID